jgi:predicted MPP superfamily phosphohydrolase
MIVFIFHSLTYLTAERVFDLEFKYGYLIIAFLSTTFILANLFVRTIKHQLSDVFYFITASWLGVVFIAFSATVFYGTIRFILGQDSPVLFASVITISLWLSGYALFQGRCIHTKTITVPIRNLKNTIKIVHLADLHIGTVHQLKFLRRVVGITNSLSPDLVLMTGDLFDGSVPIEEEMLRPLNDLQVPAYFSTGNHEEYEGLLNVKKTIKSLKMKLLDKEVADFNGIQIIGVNDRSSIPKDVSLDSILEELSLDEEKPAILMYHTPVEWEGARKHGVDLMLSGHTHNGQIYPFNLLVRMSFKYINGLYKLGDRYLHVSPGTGTWGPPMRLGSKNQITLLNLVPKNDL